VAVANTREEKVMEVTIVIKSSLPIELAIIEALSLVKILIFFRGFFIILEAKLTLNSLPDFINSTVLLLNIKIAIRNTIREKSKKGTTIQVKKEIQSKETKRLGSVQ
jgi:hypothetical protein